MPSTTAYKFGDIVLVPFPFTITPSRKSARRSSSAATPTTSAGATSSSRPSQARAEDRRPLTYPHGRIPDRQARLELRGRAAGCRPLLLRIRRAVDAAPLSQDGRPVDGAALQSRSDCSAGVGMEGVAAARGRGARRAVPREPGEPRRQAGHARRHLQRRSVRDPQPGAAQTTDRQPAR